MAVLSVNNILFLTVFMLILCVIALFSYAIFLRVRLNRRQHELELKKVAWERSVLESTTGDQPDSQTVLEIEHEDWIYFAEFVEQYLLDLRGEDYDAITEYLKKTNLLDHLLEALSSPKAWERAYAVQFLGLMKCTRAIPYLDRLVDDPVQMVSVIALEALSRVGNTDNFRSNIRRVLSKKHLTEKKIADVLLAYGPEIDAVLLDLLADPSLSVDAQRIVIVVLTYRNVTESLPMILKIGMNTTNTELIVSCIKAAGAFGDPASLELLESHVVSSEWVIRSQAVRALGSVSSPLILPELKIRLQTDKNYWVRLYSAESIARFGSRGIDILKTVQETSNNKEIRAIIGYVLESREAAKQ